MQEELIKELLLKEIGVEAGAISVLTGGQVGSVYKVDTVDKSYVVKLVVAQEEPAFPDEPRDDRVYGSRWSNLLPAYELLKNSGVLVPEIHATGTLGSERLHYEIVDYLEGSPEDYSAGWFSVVGESFGHIHGIKRQYQGWVGMTEPYAETWSDAFTKSLVSQLEEAKPFIEEHLYDSVQKHISDSGTLNDPTEFVLSHTDGFQGVLKKNGEWRLAGVVDIEDYQFTDQRFVLAGFELSHWFNDRVVPKEFWDSYTKFVAVDPTFGIYKKLFQIYYLLVWIRVLRDQLELHRGCISKLTQLVQFS